MAGEPVPLALVSLVRRNRRRYGGYLVHAGVAVLFVGVAASSSFADERDVRLSPGGTVRVGGYDLTYERPTSELVAASNGRLERIDFGARLRVERDGSPPATLVTERSYFPSSGPMLGPISRYFEGEATSEVGLEAGWRRDLWMAISPDIGRLRPIVEEGDRVFTEADAGSLPPAERGRLLAEALRGLAARYADDPPPATFRILVSPMVTWIWIGALIVLAGALIALWPTPRTLARRVAAAYAAQVGRETRVRVPA
jgi:cytochrome c-type biogenesis protein CcmF